MSNAMTEHGRLAAPDAFAVPVDLAVEVHTLPKFERPLHVQVRETKLLLDAPWVRSLGKLGLEVSTQGWRFPTPCEPPAEMKLKVFRPEEEQTALIPVSLLPAGAEGKKLRTRIKPPSDTVIFKERLLYMLQPPLENFFAGKQ